MRKAIFLTLDDNLISTRSGRKHSLHREDWKFSKDVLDSVRGIIESSPIGEPYLIAIITNQPQIEEGLIKVKDFYEKLNLVTTSLEKKLKLLQGSVVYNYCIDVTSYNFLPKPGMIYDLAAEYELDLVNSYLIGLTNHNLDIARLAGIKNYINPLIIK